MSESKCFCHLNGYEVKDAKSREDINKLKDILTVNYFKSFEFTDYEYVDDSQYGTLMEEKAIVSDMPEHKTLIIEFYDYRSSSEMCNIGNFEINVLEENKYYYGSFYDGMNGNIVEFRVKINNGYVYFTIVSGSCTQYKLYLKGFSSYSYLNKEA